MRSGRQYIPETPDRDAVRFRILEALVGAAPAGVTSNDLVAGVAPNDRPVVESELGDLYASGLVSCNAQTRTWRITR